MDFNAFSKRFNGFQHLVPVPRGTKKDFCGSKDFLNHNLLKMSQNRKKSPKNLKISIRSASRQSVCIPMFNSEVNSHKSTLLTPFRASFERHKYMCHPQQSKALHPLTPRPPQKFLFSFRLFYHFARHFYEIIKS